MEPIKLLFVCTVNRMRSATAETIFQNDRRFEVKSAGTSLSARIHLTEELLMWADTILVMERHHRNHIRSNFPEFYQNKKIVCLYIEDEYEFMQPELIMLLNNRVDDYYVKMLL